MPTSDAGYFWRKHLCENEELGPAGWGGAPATCLRKCSLKTMTIIALIIKGTGVFEGHTVPLVICP